MRRSDSLRICGVDSSRFLGITADEGHGGLAMGYQAHCVVMEEISRASGSLPSSAEDLDMFSRL